MTTTCCRLAGLALLFATLTGCPKLGDMMRQFGYTELKPPSQLMMPGTMVYVEGTKPFKAGVICTQAMSLGKAFKPTLTPTSNSTLNRANNVKVDVGADVLELLKGKVEVSAIKTISVQLHNPTIYTLTDLDVLSAIKERDPLCSEAVAGRLRAGFAVTMIARALMADVTYNVVWKQSASVDAKTKIELLSQIAPQLGVSQGSVHEQSIVGKNLFWGVMDDTYLSRLSLQGNAPGPSGGAPGQLPPRDPDALERIIPIDANPVVPPHVDTDDLDPDDDEEEGGNKP